MYINKDARVKMHNSTVEQNRAQFGAGSAFLLGSFGNLTDSIMRENYAQYDGGAVYIEDATLNIFMVHMVRNLAEARGGGAYVDKNGKFYPTRATFTENSALGEGGALYFGHNSINDVKACQFYSNWAKSSAGAIFITATRDVKVNTPHKAGGQRHAVATAHGDRPAPHGEDGAGKIHVDCQIVAPVRASIRDSPLFIVGDDVGKETFMTA